MNPMARAVRRVAPTVTGLAVVAAFVPAPVQAALTVGPGGAATDPTTVARTDTSQVSTVVAVSIDGLKPWAIRTLGAERAPVLHRLMAEGASTLNARTARELTDTLPNHTGMLTGRRIDEERGGHGVTWNDDRTEPATVHDAAGEPVESVFSVVSDGAGTPALFASKSKFALFERSWGDSIDRFLVREHNGRLAGRVRSDLIEHERSFRFVHFSRPDKVGHHRGFRSQAYLDAVARTDTLLGRVVAALEEQGLADQAVLVVTADHGGAGGSHRDPTRLANYRVPFLAWGAGVARDADLYDLNPDYANPGRRRTGYATAPPPVRNAALPNLVTDLLGLPAVPGSEFNAGQDLDLQ